MVKIIRKDKILSGSNGNLESVIVHNSAGETVETYNGKDDVGVFVTVEGLMEGQRELKKATLASEESAGKEVLLIHNPEYMYDERLNKLEDFLIPEGVATRAYYLSEGDIITLTEDLFDGDVEVGQTVLPTQNGKLGVREAVEGEKVAFEVIEDSGYELHNRAQAYAVQVKRI